MMVNDVTNTMVNGKKTDDSVPKQYERTHGSILLRWIRFGAGQRNRQTLRIKSLNGANGKSSACKRPMGVGDPGFTEVKD